MDDLLSADIDNLITNNCDINTDGSEYEEEERLIFVELADFDTSHEEPMFLRNSSKINIKNLMNTHPTCNIDNFLFSGAHEINIGTMLFVAPTATDSNTKQYNTTQEKIKIVGHTITKTKFHLTKIPSS